MASLYGQHQTERERLKAEGYALIEERAKIYGPPHQHFEAVAKAWSKVLAIRVTPYEVCRCMVELKKERERFKHNDDNIRDEGGYERLAFMMISKENPETRSWLMHSLHIRWYMFRRKLRSWL